MKTGENYTYDIVRAVVILVEIWWQFYLEEFFFASFLRCYLVIDQLKQLDHHNEDALLS